MVKMSFTSNQVAFDYALYMIAASYFDKAICKSKLTEGNMLLQYKEQKLDKQYQMEDVCIRYMDRLMKELPREIFSQDVEVHLRRKAVGEPTQILFVGDRYSVKFSGTYKGTKSEIDSRVLTR